MSKIGPPLEVAYPVRDAFAAIRAGIAEREAEERAIRERNRKS